MNTFLSAIKSRDPERISNAVALRSRTEAKDANKPLFEAMLDKNLTEDAISDLARSYEGMSVINYSALSETGKVSVRVGKQNGREVIERSLIVRKEKAGWKVLDFDKFREYVPMGTPGKTNTRPGGRRR
ncbi:MAG: hypothetical protein U0800_02630 [Isosphaeraceae bacterium]